MSFKYDYMTVDDVKRFIKGLKSKKPPYTDAEILEEMRQYTDPNDDKIDYKIYRNASMVIQQIISDSELNKQKSGIVRQIGVQKNLPYDVETNIRQFAVSPTAKAVNPRLGGKTRKSKKSKRKTRRH